MHPASFAEFNSAFLTEACPRAQRTGTPNPASPIRIIAAGFATAYTLSIWPDVIVGLAIGVMNADAAREVWTAARKEHGAAQAAP